MFWDWRHPLTFRRESQHFHTELLVAIAKLRVAATALRNEIENPIEGGDDGISRADRS